MPRPFLGPDPSSAQAVRWRPRAPPPKQRRHSGEVERRSNAAKCALTDRNGFRSAARCPWTSSSAFSRSLPRQTDHDCIRMRSYKGALSQSVSQDTPQVRATMTFARPWIAAASTWRSPASSRSRSRASAKLWAEPSSSRRHEWAVRTASSLFPALVPAGRFRPRTSRRGLAPTATGIFRKFRTELVQPSGVDGRSGPVMLAG